MILWVNFVVIMDDTFRIFVYRLKDGSEEKLSETLPPDFMEVHEAELAFKAPVIVQGRATVTDDVLILRLNIETEACMPCSVCNQESIVKIKINNFCHTEKLSEIKGGVYDYRSALREGILLELPLTAECNGDCPERASLAQYLN